MTTVTRIRPTTTGIAVFVAFIVVVLLSENQRLAIGFFVALGILMIVDAVVAHHAVSTRDVTVRPIRTVGVSEDARAFTAWGDQGGLPLAVEIPNASALLAGRPVRTLLPTDGSVTQAVQAPGPPGVELAFRFSVSATWIGLMSAYRWYGVEVPAGLWRGVRSATTDATPVPLTDELARLRDYVPGDRMSRVSWPTTARTGRLHVRSEGIESAEVLVEVDLGPPGAAAEVHGAILKQASDAVGSLLRRGHTVRIVSRVVGDAVLAAEAEAIIARPHRMPALAIRIDGDDLVLPSGAIGNAEVRSSPVVSDDDLQRALARVVPGPPLPSSGRSGLRVGPDGVRGSG
ncbi:MAG: DUF58 domain-containing protein [Actinomycetota bacterium]